MQKYFEKIVEWLEKSKTYSNSPQFERGLDYSIKIVNNVAEEYKVSEKQTGSNDATVVLHILDKFEMFQGQRAGRELWGEKPEEVQDRDIENFNRDLNIIRDFVKTLAPYEQKGGEDDDE